MKTGITLVLICIAVHAQAQTSDENPRLKAVLKRFPQADANGDGVLTLAEAKAFKEQQEPSAETKTKQEGDGIHSSYIYKTVGDEKLELFVATPPGHTTSAQAPAIVLFHGGGFKSGTVSQFQSQSEHLARRGMVAIRVRYRLTSAAGVEVQDCVEDAISAMRWVREHAPKLGVDPNRIASGGGSAGGYLAAATLLIDFIHAKTDPPGVSAKPNALVLWNPAFGIVKELTRSKPQDPDGKGDLSQYVQPQQPPMINFYGTEDPFLAEAKQFQKVYEGAGNRFQLVTYEGEKHSFFNKEPYLGRTLAEADQFLVALGWLEPPKKTP
jgi:acetyl esterase/lipase